jgi:alpha-L-rhamnosidase
VEVTLTTKLPMRFTTRAKRIALSGACALSGVVPALLCGQDAGVVTATPIVWKAQWIASPGMTKDTAEMPVFRKQFTLKSAPARAVLNVSALGQGEVHLNGARVGDQEFAPAWTDYRKTVRYETFDVTKMLRSGANVVGVMVGNGMFNVVKTPKRYTKLENSFGVPQILLQMEVWYRDGSQELIVSDGTWQSTPGPITFSSTYGGEDYDAGRELAGWDSTSPAIQSTAWSAAAAVPGPKGDLLPEVAPAIRVMKTHPAVKTAKLRPGVTVYDLGQNFAGWPSIAVHGEKGATLKLIPSELLNADGSVSQASSGGPQWFSYTLKGGSVEHWHPRFSYYGFRYIQAEWTGSGQIDSLAGEAVHSSAAETGDFESSNAMLNAIHRLIVEAMRNNEVSLFTDCPHREKLGWLEQTHLVAPGLLFNNDLRGLYAATDRNMLDAQLENGDVPTIAPQYTRFGRNYSVFDDSPEWGSAVVLAPWAAYRYYGDINELQTMYPAMQRYVSFLETKATNGIVAYGLGDWYDIGPGEPGMSKLTTLGVTGTLMLYQDAVTLEKIAHILGRDTDAATYAALAEREKAAFNDRFFDPANGYYDKGSQTAQAMPLDLGIVPDGAKSQVLAKLITDIQAHDDHTTAGEIGFPYLIRTLMENGRSDLLLAMLLRKDPPSYGSQLAAGATALTEAWNANPRNSQDHFMLGSAEEWFDRGLAGIDVDMSRTKEERITIRPQIVESVDWVRGSYNSTMGVVKSEWRREHGEVIVTLNVPVKVTIDLPGDERRVLSAGAHRIVIKRQPPR